MCTELRSLWSLACLADGCTLPITATAHASTSATGRLRTFGSQVNSRRTTSRRGAGDGSSRLLELRPDLYPTVPNFALASRGDWRARSVDGNPGGGRVDRVSGHRPGGPGVACTAPA